jgi:hypothetical protein
MKTFSLTLLSALAFFPAAMPMFGEIIVSDTAGGTSGSSSAFQVVSWTQTETFTSVSIEAQLKSNLPTQSTGTAYLSNDIGPGAGSGNLLDTFAVSTNNNADGVLIPLFSGLTLGPGTYYLSLLGNGGLYWTEAGSPVQTLNGATQGPDLISTGPIGTPAISTGFNDSTTGHLLFQVSGTPAVSTATPEPSTIVLLVACLGSMVFARRLRKGRVAV